MLAEEACCLCATRQQYKQATALEALVRLLVFYALGVQ